MFSLTATPAWAAVFGPVNSQVPPSFSQGLQVGGEIDVRSRGAICDGTIHTVGSVYSTLAAAQAVYPFITSLLQTLDYAGIQKTTYDALGYPGSEHAYAGSGANLTIFIPNGSCQLGTDTWTIRNAVGAHIRGGGNLSANVVSNNTALAIDGMWYSVIETLTFRTVTTTGTVAFDLDGNVPGHPYATRATQGNTIRDVTIDGGMSSYAFAMCRLGGSGAQCSENQFYNLHLSSASQAAYFQTGFNALDNNWFGGDCQVYTKFCILLQAGSMGIFKVSFESTTGYTQIANGGWDIDASYGGTGESITVVGARTESLRFYHGGASQRADLQGILHEPAVYHAWQTSGFYPNGTALIVADLNGKQRLYVSSGGTAAGSTQPTWPASGTVTDNTITWTMTPYAAVDANSGELNMRTSTFDPSAQLIIAGSRYQKTAGPVTANYTTANDDNLVMVDATSGSFTVTLNDDAGAQFNAQGHTVTVKRTSTAANAVTVAGVFGGNVTMAASTLDTATFIHANNTWYLLSYYANNVH